MASLTLLGQRMTANAAAIATAAAGGLVTADITALGSILATMALFPTESIPLINRSGTPSSPNITTPT